MDHTGLLYVIGFGFAATTFVFGTILFSWLITHRLPLTQADHAIELLSADANKILFLPSLT